MHRRLKQTEGLNSVKLWLIRECHIYAHNTTVNLIRDR